MLLDLILDLAPAQLFLIIHWYGSWGVTRIQQMNVENPLEVGARLGRLPVPAGVTSVSLTLMTGYTVLATTRTTPEQIGQAWIDLLRQPVEDQ